MNQPAERRALPRKRAQLFIQIVLASEQERGEPHPIYCRSADISAEGLRLNLDEEIEPESRMELLVSEPSRSDSFLLKGTSRWCHEREDKSGFQIGVWLESGSGDLGRWQARFVG